MALFIQFLSEEETVYLTKGIASRWSSHYNCLRRVGDAVFSVTFELIFLFYFFLQVSVKDPSPAMFKSRFSELHNNLEVTDVDYFLPHKATKYLTHKKLRRICKYSSMNLSEKKGITKQKKRKRDG